MKYLSLLLMLSLFSVITVSTDAEASKLKKYKKQKHSKRKRVTKASCKDDYIAACTKKCSAGDASCVNKCQQEAAPFCKEREKRQFRKKLGLAAKAGSLAIGAAVVGLDDDMDKVSAEGTKALSPYAIIWNNTSFNLDIGAGTIEGGGGTVSANTRIRKSWYGFGVNYSHLQDKTEFLKETDFGPTFSFGGANSIYTFQLSVLQSIGNGVKQETGYGIRTYTRWYMGRAFLRFDPLLGYINDNWQYHLITGFGYRMTPNWTGMITYEYRDLVDLNDLEISDTTLHTILAYIQLRFN